jgi:hypothetical protein
VGGVSGTHAPVVDRLPFGPARRENPSTDVYEILFRHVDVEGAYCSLFPNRTGHNSFLSAAHALYPKIAPYSCGKGIYVPHSTKYHGAQRQPFGERVVDPRPGPDDLLPSPLPVIGWSGMHHIGVGRHL